MNNKISRKEFLRISGLSSGFGAISALRAAKAPGTHAGATRLRQARKPNVLVILTDQERSWETLPRALALPRRQKFLVGATNFTRHHITTLSCGPSRSVILTGQHVQSTGVTENASKAGFGHYLDPQKTPTIAQMLRAEGYRTAYKGKWHLSYEGELDDYTGALKRFGFDEWHPSEDTFGRAYEGYRLDGTIAHEAAEFMARAGGAGDTQPWFLIVSLINPHDTMWFDATGEQHRTRILNPFVSEMGPAPDDYPYTDDLGFDLPANFKDDLSTKPDVQHQFIQQGRYFYGHMDLDDEESFRRAQNHYFNCLRDGDRHIGTILDALENSGQADRTAVVLTADHGEMGSSHKMRNKGPLLYKEVLSVPFAVRHPDVRGGKQSAALMSSIDIAPTLLAIAGVEESKMRDRYPDLKGFDFGPWVASAEDDGPRERDPGGLLFNYSNATTANPRMMKNEMLIYKKLRETGVETDMHFPDDYVQFESRQFGRGIHNGRYKFCRWFSPSDHHRPEKWSTLIGRNDLELYDTVEDPEEMVNLAHEPESNKQRIESLNRQLNRLLDAEVGRDDGSHMPGSPDYWTA